MAQSHWPAQVGGVRVVDDLQYERLSARYSDDGLYWQPSDPAPVYADGTGRHVKLRAGLLGSVRGFGWTSGDSVETLSVSANATGTTRYDRAVLRLDRSDWSLAAVVKEGGSSAPGLTRQTGATGVFEVHLGVVTVPAGAVTLTAGQVSSVPTAVGSRIRPQTSASRNPAPAQGEVAFDHDTGQWVGWTGSRWAVIWEDTEGQANVSIASGWTSSGGSNVVRRRGGVAELQLSMNRTGSSVEMESGIDNHADGLLMATVPVGYRPPTNRHFPAVFTRDLVGRVSVHSADGRVYLSKISGDLGGEPSLTQCWTYFL